MIRIPLSDSLWEELEAGEKIDFLCDLFEQTLQRGERLSTADYLPFIEPAHRLALLRELMILEREYRGQPPTTHLPTLSGPPHAASGAWPTSPGWLSVRASSPRGALDPWSSLPRAFGSYILVRVLGRGASCDVFLAERLDDGLACAVKIPTPRLLADPEQLEALEREARSLALLKHPRIARLQQFGYSDNIPFLATDYIPGMTLKEYLAQKRPISHRQAAHWIAELADCLQHAHDRGVIHRDLKPANVMIHLETDAGDGEEQGSREPILVPCLLDFGISRCLRDNPSLTLPGEMVGTPSYTSPEQANGRSREASRLSDIYSLGAIFYEMLAGHPPFRGEPLELLRQIGEREVPPLAECGQTIDAELAAICHRALRLRPAARYRSAGELADDLRRWLRGVPALKQPPGWQGWPQRRAQGKAGTSWGRLGLIACVTVLLGGLGFQLSRRDATSSLAFLHQSKPGTALLPQESALEAWLQDLPQAFSDPSPLIASLRKKSSGDRLLQIARRLQPHTPAAIRLLEELYHDQEPDSHAKKMIAGLYGWLAPQAFAELEAANPLVELILRSDFLEQESPWFELTHPVRHQLIASTTDLYAKANNSPRRQACLHLLLGWLDETTLLESLTAAMLASPDELMAWKTALVPYREQALELMAICRQELGLVQAMHVEGEKRARGYANLLLLEYGLGCTHRLSEALASLDDPRPRSYFVHQLADSGFSHRGLLELLAADQPPSVLYAILLALAEFDSHQWTEEERSDFEHWVVEQYQQHSDVGVHGMCRWYLRQWKRQEDLQALDARLASQGLVVGRQWYVHRLGITMGIFAPPTAIPYWGEFNQRGTFRRLAAPEYFTLPQPFAISLEEITVGQYQPFAKAKNEGGPRSSGEASFASDEVPMVSLSWDEALGFCQWLSELDGLSPVATTIEDRSKRPQVQLDFTSSGYRLPKFAECQYAFNAGAIPSRCFGTALTPFENRYVEFPTSAEGMRSSLRPNRFGIFQAMDNVAEWTATRFNPLLPISQQALVPTESYGEGHRVLTTGSSYIPSNSILFTPQATDANQSSAKIGFRLCRSLPMDETAPTNPTTWNPPGARSDTATVSAASRRGSGSMSSAGFPPDDNKR